MRLTHTAQHVEKGWAGHETLQHHVHEAVDAGVYEPLVRLAELSHREHNRLSQFQLDATVLFQRVGYENRLVNFSLLAFVDLPSVRPQGLQIVQIKVFWGNYHFWAFFSWLGIWGFLFFHLLF